MLISNSHTIAKILDINVGIIANIDFRGVGFDTRKPIKDKLFVALVGDNFDAHNYANQAQKMGAAAMLVEKMVDTNLPILLVKNTQLAFSAIASWHLQNIKPTVIAITGSNGKTTCKNMLKNILQLKAPTLATKGNLNNHLGVPMTLLELEPKHRYAVIEMGANHLGEIAYLRQMTMPDIAVVTNTLDAHIGEFGGFANLVQAKGEIYAKNSKNIVNTSTTFSGDISFGEAGDIFASNINNQQFELNIFAEKITVKLQLFGKHNIENALAAASCAYALGMDIKTIKQGLENTPAEKGRLKMIKKGSLMIIDDSYNASPSSVKYALEVLASFKGERIAVLAQMAELGAKSIDMHHEIGNYAKTLGIDHIYSVGSHAKQYGVQHFENATQLLARLKKHTNATLLFKGSRIAKLEQIIAKL